MPTKEDKPLTREQLRMVAEFRKYRDVYKAAEKAKIPKNSAVRTFNLPAFQEELDRQDEVVRNERAKLEVHAEALTRDFLDKELMGLVQKETGSLKKEALALGYVVIGAIQNGSTRSLTAPVTDPNDDRISQGAPTFVYHATVAGTLTQTPEPIVPQETKAPAIPPAPPPVPSKPTVNRTGPLKIG